ncbi:MAG: AI-2E family transporter [Nanoarchaeota archaeon]|nr:AI-2E family transporter [Nanoarchaeota archaeon]MBU1051368.1 AI-2E family transporter [Nanoarchaeota archaeon]MBU1988383.1 AI-2E family transporter [Nanoarchaeota archaeon]
MTLTEKDVKRISLIVLIALLGILVFLIIRPVLLSIIGGLILAYIFFPVYKWIAKKVKYRSLAAALVSVLVLLIIFIPLWFLLPLMSQQVFALFQFSQELDINSLVRTIFPSSSEQFIVQISATATNAVTKITSSILNSIVDFLINFAVISLHLLLVAFVFFFALKDESKLREFASGLSPLNKSQEKHLIKKFKDITGSIIYGQIVAGVLQGIFAGIGFFVFGIPNALVLTVLATMLSIIPVIGPSLIYIPVAIYLIITGNPLLAIGFLLYNVLIVSSVDTIFRSLFVSRRTRMSQAVILVGMIGGLFIFGILGLILGPLILAYFITFLTAYKEKTLSSLFGP